MHCVDTSSAPDPTSWTGAVADSVDTELAVELNDSGGDLRDWVTVPVSVTGLRGQGGLGHSEPRPPPAPLSRAPSRRPEGRGQESRGAGSPPPEVILGVPLSCPSPSSCLPGCPDGATRGKECWEEQPSRERRPVLGSSPGGKGPGHSVSSCSGAAANHQHEFRGRCPWIFIPMEKFLRLPFSFRTSV